MKIAICGSIQFTEKMKEISDELEQKNHVVELPLTSQKILAGEISLEEFKNESEKEDRKIKHDVIRRYFNIIKELDAILIVNEEKKGIPHYIGGNTFLEMGFAHVLDKKIYILNGIPEMLYTDEIKAMQPILLNGDVQNI